MNTDRGENIRVFFRQSDGAFKISRLRLARPNGEHHFHARVFGTSDNFVAVSVKFCAVNMAMRINKNHF
jgi:hypothetical protein